MEYPVIVEDVRPEPMAVQVRVDGYWHRLRDNSIRTYCGLEAPVEKRTGFREWHDVFDLARCRSCNRIKW